MITAHQIIQEVALHFNVSDFTFYKSRSRESVEKYCAVYICDQLTPLNRSEIAKVFNYADHSPVLRAIKEFDQMMVADEKLAAATRKIIDALDFKSRLILTTDVDVNAIARNVAKQPRRAGISLSVNEVAALALGYLEMAEVARAGERLAIEITAMANASDGKTLKTDESEIAALTAVSRSIIDTMAAMSGEEGKK